MCNGTKQKPSLADSVIENIERDKNEISALLEFSACDDLASFKTAIEQESLDIDKPSSWYGRRIGSKKLSFENRTPLMVAAMFGSKNILGYILESGRADVNQSCGSDRATALHCAVAGGVTSLLDVVRILLRSCADPNALDVNGNQPVDLIVGSSLNPKRKLIEVLLKSSCMADECVFNDLIVDGFENKKEETLPTTVVSKDGVERKEYPVDLTLPDIKNGIYGTDEFRMYMFKVKPCSRAYSHDWTECPFVHPGENARRRDPRKYHYSCVPCPEFRKGTCRQADNCDYAHGIFECWLHPAQYRTRLCKDETNCTRRVCFFAHKTEELRPLYASTGSGLPSPRSFSNGNTPFDFSSNGSSLMMNAMNRSQTGSELDTELFYTLSQLQGFSMDAMSAQQVRSARASAFAKRSQSFIDRGTTRTSLFSGNSSSALSPNNFNSSISDWGSPDGKLDWGIKKDELNKLRKSASFGFRSSESSVFSAPAASRLAMAEEPDVSWVQSLVKDGPTNRTGELDTAQSLQYLYLDQEQMVA